MSDLHPDLERQLISAKQIEARVAELAEQISQDYAGEENLYLIGILKGAFIFLADLSRQITVPHIVDFMALPFQHLQSGCPGFRLGENLLMGKGAFLWHTSSF